jgi:hypothetical protein
MKAYAVVQGPRRKVLAVALDSWWARFLAASSLDYEAICGIAGSQHNVSRVLREHKARLTRIEFELADKPAGSTP